ncbi:MAG: hypothetical protein AAF998_15315, partial [Bacteroidota bacterium]
AEVGYVNQILQFVGPEAPAPFNPEVDDIFKLGIYFKRAFPLHKNRLYVAPLAGIGGGWVPRHRRAFRGSWTTAQDTFSIAYQSPQLPDRMAVFVAIGLDIEWVFASGVRLSLSAVYNQGLRKLIDHEVLYARAGTPTESYRFNHRGTHLPITLGVAYPISRIWQGKINPD